MEPTEMMSFDGNTISQSLPQAVPQGSPFGVLSFHAFPSSQNTNFVIKFSQFIV
jgi:hypothetical protein